MTVDCVVVKIGVPVGDPWLIGEPGHVNKKIAEKSWQKTNYFTPVFFFNDKSINNQSTISQIFNQSGKMDYADVNDT